MEIDKLFENNSIDSVADNVFGVVNNSVSEVREMQRKKVAENVQLVVNALKKIEQDIKDQYDSVSNNLEKRIISIKDGRDGIDGRDGKDGKDGKQGKDGRPGRDGKDGKNGLNGESGEDGVSVVNAHIDFDGSLIISLSSGKEINVGEVVAPALAEQIKVITNGGGTSQSVLDTLTSLQSQIDALSGATIYKGLWNASTNSPALTSSVGTSGNFYIVSVAGSTSLDGITNWGVGDWAIFNGSVWQRVEGGAAGNFTTVTASSLTSGRVTYAGTAGLLQDSSNLTFNGTTLTSTGFSGPLNGTVGATTPAAGAFTTVSATGAITSTLNGVSFNVNTGSTGTNAIYQVTNGTQTGRLAIAADNSIYVGATSAHSFNILASGSPVGTFSSTGLAVTGTISATGAATFPAGTALLPSITTTGDTNTGIYFPAADTIAFTEGGAEAMRIDSSGNVGVGTASPGAKLQLNTGTTTTVGQIIQMVASQTADVLRVTRSDTNLSLQFTPSGQLSIGDFAVPAATVITTGPSTSTNANLKVSGSNVGNPNIFIQSQQGGGGALGGPTSFVYFGDNNRALSYIGGTKVNAFAANASSDLVFGTTSDISTIAVTERMRINSSGGVSIGSTSSPGAGNLLVNGGTITTGSTTALSLATSGGAGVVVSHVASAVNYIQIAPAATTGSPFILANGSDTNVSLSVSSKGSTDIDFFTDTFASQAVRITHTASANRCITLTGSNGGNPTIGTSAGALGVSASINCSSEIRSAVTVADYAGFVVAGTGGNYQAGVNGADAVVFTSSGNLKLQYNASGTATGGYTFIGNALGGFEQTAPPAPAANGYYIYAEDNGAGKTRLMVRFATGASQQIAIEP